MHANCAFILPECTEEKICFTKENSQSYPQIISSNIADPSSTQFACHVETLK